MSRDIFAKKAIEEIPKILTLLDRNPHSPTYGCFDRNYWHYKIIDFPSGMSQEFVWPLALVYSTNISENPFYQKEVLKDWVCAGISFAAKSSHNDSSCDDYYPYEMAAGAAAFSLLAFIESYKAFDLNDEKFIDFFCKRADWLAGHDESGRLSNHQALIVLCLELMSDLLKTSRWDRKKQDRLEKVLSWQDDEGWFQEYEGCDPGYHTLTISLLARVYDLNPGNSRLREALIRAVNLAAHFIHQDGTYGGEYASRNTNNYFPHGFELVGKWEPDALFINDRFAEALSNNMAPCYSDDHILGHHTWNYLLTWRDYISKRPNLPLEKKPERTWLKNAGILIDRRKNTDIYIALNKGGVFKVFSDSKLICSDTQMSLLVKKGNKLKNAVGHLIDDYQVSVSNDTISVKGKLGWAKQKQMTYLNMLILRMIMLSIGRFFPDTIRRILQWLLITGKQNADFYFERIFTWKDECWEVCDRLKSNCWESVESAVICCDQTSIYIAMSRTFHVGQLSPNINLSNRLSGLKPGEILEVRRKIK